MFLFTAPFLFTALFLFSAYRTKTALLKKAVRSSVNSECFIFSYRFFSAQFRLSGNLAKSDHAYKESAERTQSAEHKLLGRVAGELKRRPDYRRTRKHARNQPDRSHEVNGKE